MSDWNKIIVDAMGYTDVHGMARAATLMGLARDEMWTKCISKAKKEHGAEIKAGIEGTKRAWTSNVEVCDDAKKDIIAKVLIAHGTYPYPELVSGLMGEKVEKVKAEASDTAASATAATPIEPATPEQAELEAKIEAERRARQMEELNANPAKPISQTQHGLSVGQVGTPDRRTSGVVMYKDENKCGVNGCTYEGGHSGKHSWDEDTSEA